MHGHHREPDNFGRTQTRPSLFAVWVRMAIGSRPQLSSAHTRETAGVASFLAFWPGSHLNILQKRCLYHHFYLIFFTGCDDLRKHGCLYILTLSATKGYDKLCFLLIFFPIASRQYSVYLLKFCIYYNLPAS